MRRLLLLSLAPAAAAIVIAGCGGGTHSGYGGAKTAAASPPLTVTSAPSTLGTVLVDGKGRTVYLFEKDARGRSSCSGACASVWPPVPASTGTGGSLKAADLGVIRRGDGRSEATYAGHPLYYYAGDTKPGQATGQGLDQFGGGWYVLAPSGRKIEDEKS